jgi:hypothetical protein
MSFFRLVIFIVLFFVLGCDFGSNDLFPFKQGKIWSYSINLFSSYTGQNSEKRVLITNLQTKKVKNGYEVTRLHSDGNFFIYRIDNKKKTLSRIAAILVNQDGLIEPVKKDVYPDLDFKKKKWVVMEQLFLIKGFQPPLENFKPQIRFEMNYFVEREYEKFKYQGKVFNNCFYLVGNGSTSFIADTRSGSINVDIKSEEWICRGIGVVKQVRTEDTEASAFGKMSLTKELVYFK